MPRPALAVHWPSQPWSRHNNAALARMLGCHENTVAEHRAVHAPHTTRTPGRPVTVDLSKADFTQHDTTIAFIYECHPDTVREWRRTHKVPACTKPLPGGSGRPRVYDRSRFDASRTARENAEAMGCSRQMAWLLLKEHKNRKPMKKGKK